MKRSHNIGDSQRTCLACILILYSNRVPSFVLGKQRMSASLEEGDGVFEGSSTQLSLGLNGGEKYQHEPNGRLLCTQCHQRMERASVGK